jgi:hypothetical protein
VTLDGEVRRVEKLLAREPNTIAAPLWVSGNKKNGWIHAEREFRLCD